MIRTDGRTSGTPSLKEVRRLTSRHSIESLRAVNVDSAQVLPMSPRSDVIFFVRGCIAGILAHCCVIWRRHRDLKPGSIGEHAVHSAKHSGFATQVCSDEVLRADACGSIVVPLNESA